MIKDYSVYMLSQKERLAFYGVGYVCIFVVVYLFYHSFLLAIPAGVTIYRLRTYAEKYMAEKRLNSLNMQFKDMLYSLSASVAAGRQMEEALIEAEGNLSTMYSCNEPIMRELRHIRIAITENKESDKLLLTDLAVRTGSEDINNFVQVYLTCRNMGGNLERIIGHAVEVLSDKMTIDREIKALTTQKKTEGRIISIMPLLMLLMLNVMSFSYIEPLYSTFAGRLIMTAALAASVYGVYLMEKISHIKV